MCVNPLYAILTRHKNNNTIKVVPKKSLTKFKGYKNNFKNDIEKRLFYKAHSVIELPCGNCVECRLDYARNWSNRLMLESYDYPENEKYFLTLTYNDDNISNNESDKNKNIYSLRKRDVQLFFKRLRKDLFVKHGFYPKIRYYASGEYGDKSFRPHYHIIIFGLSISDITLYKTSSQGFNYYISEWLSNIWQKGYVVIAPFSWQTANYTARYVMKKHKGKDKDFYDKLGVEPEFSLVSRRPGIGFNYYKKNLKNIYMHDEIYMNDIDKGGMIFRPP